MALFLIKNVNFKDIINYPELEIANGAATFICGESGCGKSTLLKLLNGVTSASHGEILYNGISIADYDPIELRREVLLCGQSAFLFDGSIRNNFEQFYKHREVALPSDEGLAKYLEICGISFELDTPCEKFSGGERQRVFTAICLSLRPKVLMLDEPTSALDDATAHLVVSNIKEFCKSNGITMIAVSHNKILAKQYADDVIELKAADVRRAPKVQ